MTESRFELRTFGSDTKLNHHLSQKFKLIGRGKFDHLINTLTSISVNLLQKRILPKYSSWMSSFYFLVLISKIILLKLKKLKYVEGMQEKPLRIENENLYDLQIQEKKKKKPPVKVDYSYNDLKVILTSMENFSTLTKV
jgi:hypothetical protein